VRPKSVVEVLHLPMPDGLQSLFQRRLGRRTLKRLRHRRSIKHVAQPAATTVHGNAMPFSRNTLVKAKRVN